MRYIITDQNNELKIIDPYFYMTQEHAKLVLQTIYHGKAKIQSIKNEQF